MGAITGEWLEKLAPEFKKPYYRELYSAVQRAYASKIVYPPAAELFSAYEAAPLSRVKVVILGQDPYHEPGQAHGMCFSVRPGVEVPPSLENIYKELHDDLDFRIPNHGYLMQWAEQGVLLLNTVLTVEQHRAGSHRGIGWEKFTDATIRVLNEEDRPIVFLLWGRPAGEKAAMLTNPKHLVLQAPHPSPLSAYRGFFGCRHFSKTNEFLEKNGLEPIHWQIEDIH